MLAQALKMSPSEAKQLEVIPIVVFNIGAGFSLEADGCRVVNASFLRAYLGSRHYRTGAALRYGRTAYERAAVYYENEVEASECFAAIMARPWTLDRFLRRMVRDETAYPRPTGGEFAIASAFRGDFTFEERREHEGLLAYVGSQEGARTGRP